MRLHKRGPTQHELPILDAEPELDLGARMCLKAWHELDSCRLPEQRPTTHKKQLVYIPVHGPIPFTAIVEWARLNELDEDATKVLVAAIQRLDVEREDRISSELRSSK